MTSKRIKSIIKTKKGGESFMQNIISKQKGFTLVEILIVVVILGILAGVVIPQFTSSSEDAKLSTLRTDLTALRSAMELYYNTHNNTYPGAVTSNYLGHATDEEWFVDQLTLYTNANGEAVSVKDATHKYGPYLKNGIPVNPFDDDNTVTVDVVEDDLAVAAADQSGGWLFFALTGQFFANDSDASHGSL
jgi:general secretion pathway protein G